MEKNKGIEKRWTEIAKEQLLGKKIVGVRYLKPEETKNMAWRSRCVVIILDDGNMIYPSMDEEGNGPGVLFTNNKKEPTLPTIP